MSNVRYGLQDDRQTASKRNVELGRGGEAQSWKLTIIWTFCNLTLFFWIILSSYKYVVKAQFIKSWLLAGRKVCAIRRKLLWAKRRKTDQPRKLWVTSTSDSVCRIHSNNCTRPPWRTRTEKKQLKDVLWQRTLFNCPTQKVCTEMKGNLKGRFEGLCPLVCQSKLFNHHCTPGSHQESRP